MQHRRQSVDLDPSDAKAAFDLLPPFTSNKYVTYSDSNMKHAPKWAELAPFRPTIFRLLHASKGLSINQVSLLSGFNDWLGASNGAVNHAEAEKAVYLMRCMVNQLINHKVRNRKPPREMARAYASIFEIIDETGNAPHDDDDDDDDDDGVEIVAVAPATPSPPVLDLTEGDVLQDTDPELHMLLNLEMDDKPGDEPLCPVLQDDDPELQKLLTVTAAEDCSEDTSITASFQGFTSSLCLSAGKLGKGNFLVQMFQAWESYPPLAKVDVSENICLIKLRPHPKVPQEVHTMGSLWTPRPRNPQERSRKTYRAQW